MALFERMEKTYAVLGGVFLLALTAPGCEQKEGKEARVAAERSESGAESGTGSEADGRDARPKFVRSEKLPEEPRRIVSLAPNLTETLFALGVGDRVVGVTKHCDHPEEATERPVVGSFANLNFEAILAQEPDLVVGVISGGERDVVGRLGSAGVDYAFVRMATIDGTYDGIRSIGRVVGRKRAGEELVERMRRRMRAVERSHEGSREPDVLLVYGHDPLVAAGPGTFGHELLVRAGADNVMAGAETRYPRLDGEKLIERAPERIVDTTVAGGGGSVGFWQRYASLEAVREGRVVYLRDDVVLRPGPRLPEALEKMAAAVHGGAEAGRQGAEDARTPR